MLLYLGMTALGRFSRIPGCFAVAVFLLCCGPVPVGAHEAAIATVAAPAVAAPVPPLAEPDASLLRGTAPEPSTALWGLLFALAAVTALAAQRRRHAAAVAFVTLLLVSGFENSVHSVHHLDDSRRLGECAAAWASQQVAGTVVETVAADPVPAPAVAEVVCAEPAMRPPRAPSPHEARAPPHTV